MEGLIEGRIVHYVQAVTLHNAAIVAVVHDKVIGKVDLVVFDMSIPINTVTLLPEPKYIQPHYFVPYSESKEPGTWHWIEREEETE